MLTEHVSLIKTQVLLLSRFRDRNARYTDITISKFKWKKYWYIIAVNKLSLFVILKICHHQKVFMIQTVLRLYLFLKYWFNLSNQATGTVHYFCLKKAKLIFFKLIYIVNIYFR